MRRAPWKMKTKRQTVLRAASQEKLQGSVLVANLKLFKHLHVFYDF